MKIQLLFTVVFFNYNVQAQTSLGGYPVVGYLDSVITSENCVIPYITGIPNDSIWVNISDDLEFTGTFSANAINTSGADLLLETGFHPSNYTVSLRLSDGNYSQEHQVSMEDWTELNFIDWNLQCGNNGPFPSPSYILPLDFVEDFGLTNSSVVEGVKIILRNTVGIPDIAGVYLVGTITGIQKQISTLGFCPNPFTNSSIAAINVVADNLQVRMFNSYGKSVKPNVVIRSSEIEIQKANLPEGIYFLQVWNNEKLITESRLVIN